MPGWGFNRTQGEELSDLEKSLGTKVIPSDDDLFRYYKDKWVDVQVGNLKYGGVYRGTTKEGFVVLSPSIVAEKSDKGTFYTTSSEPEMIRVEAIISVTITRKEYIEELTRGKSPQEFS